MEQRYRESSAALRILVSGGLSVYKGLRSELSFFAHVWLLLQSVWPHPILSKVRRAI